MTRLMSRISFGWCPSVRSAAWQLAKMPGCESIRVPSRSRRTEGGAMLQHSDRSQTGKSSITRGRVRVVCIFARRAPAKNQWFHRGKLVLPDRIELSTSPLPMECSTTELRQHAREHGIGLKGPDRRAVLATRPPLAQAQGRGHGDTKTAKNALRRQPCAAIRSISARSGSAIACPRTLSPVAAESWP